MKSDYKEELNKLVEKKKKEVPTSFSDVALANIFAILEYTPIYLNSIAKHFNEKSSLKPIMEGKRSFRQTLVHLLNIEGLNYTTIFPAFLLNKPMMYPLHAEKDFDRLNLFTALPIGELLEAFSLERKKTLNFFKSLKKTDWSRQLREENKAREESI